MALFFGSISYLKYKAAGSSEALIFRRRFMALRPRNRSLHIHSGRNRKSSVSFPLVAIRCLFWVIFVFHR